MARSLYASHLLGINYRDRVTRPSSRSGERPPFLCKVFANSRPNTLDDAPLSGNYEFCRLLIFSEIVEGE